MTYYNEFDKNAAAWLRELIDMELIAEGRVDERSITEVEANDIGRSNRVHWFAGIGGWDYALQLAGWPSDRPVWTASLPCQPFSLAGKGLGKNDERHLLPHFIELVDACRPEVIFGEQVPAAIGHGWLDDLCDEMEGKGYAVRASVLSAAGVGAPHIRSRLYWLAYRSGKGLEKQHGIGGVPSSQVRNDERKVIAGNCWMGDSEHKQYKGCLSGHKEKSRKNKERSSNKFAGSSENIGMGNAESEQEQPSIQGGFYAEPGSECLSSIWSDCDWLYCRDNKYRPIKSGLKPLVNGISRGMVHGSDSSITPNETGEARAMRLKGYGNAIVPQVAAEFIKSVMELI